MLAFAGAIFISAFLVFQVQPIIAKAILPWFGGTPAVWTTCLLFFQVVLLLGYAYAHASIRWLGARRQAIVHAALLALALLTLPITPDADWKPQGTEDPVLRILGLLAGTVGAPYLLLSATAPLLQAWFARSEPGKSPYRLYALSNLGSLLGLVTYPVGIEPLLTTGEQQALWSGGFLMFALVCWLCALRSLRSPDGTGSAAAIPDGTGTGAALPEPARPEPDARLYLLWIALSACGSTLLLAVTNQMCQEVAVVPFLWVLPLTLYLLSFILCFESDRWYRRAVYMPLLAAGLWAIGYVTGKGLGIALVWAIPMLAGGLFVGCMFCHGELAALRPAPRHLTAFYLMSSVGGAVGGLFVGFVAPYAFSGFWEIHFAILGCATLAVLLVLRQYPAARETRRTVIRACLHLVLGVVAVATVERFLVATERSPFHGRNFYGHISVSSTPAKRPEDTTLDLTHGATRHGRQYVDPARRHIPTSYYGYVTGIGRAFADYPRRTGRRVGLIGLGAGTLAAYAVRGDFFRFYEINPLVVDYALLHFTYLSDARRRGAEVEISLGDARISMEREAPQNYDLIVLDAFSSDSIPTHLLTRESFEIYSGHLRQDGVLAVHISNRHIDLRPVVHSLARSIGCVSWLIVNQDDSKDAVHMSHWVLVTRNLPLLMSPHVLPAGALLPGGPRLRMWTDDYSNLFQLLK